MPRTTPSISPAVQDAIAKIGADIRTARRRQFLSTTALAVGARISRSTLAKVERGDRSVSLGIYAVVLERLRLLGGLGAVADGGRDRVGRAFLDAMLPKRIHLHRRKRALAANDGQP